MTSEAGLGTASIAAAAAKTDLPGRQALGIDDRIFSGYHYDVFSDRVGLGSYRGIRIEG